MSHVVVFNSSAKTVRIPTTPVKYLTEVRDEACQRFNVSKDQFTLKYNNKPISLSQQIRLANLPQGARLELVQASRSPTVISVALQLPASERNVRLTQKFASNTSLWEILRQFESGEGANYNFTQRGVPELSSNGTSGAGRLNYEEPVVTLMPGHREEASFIGLQQTLTQLGFDSGSALLRLSFKNSGQPLEEAMTEITQYFKHADPAPSGAHAATAAQQSSLPALDNAAPEATETVAGEAVKIEEPEPEPMETDAPSVAESTQPNADNALPKQENVPQPSPSNSPTTAVTLPNPSPSGDNRNIQIFSPSTSSTPQAARQAYNEADYVPTIDHAKSHQASLQARTRNQRLPSDKELEQQEDARQEKLVAAAEKGSSIRVRLPDQWQIKLDITKSDTAETLYELVEDFLAYREPFQLKYPGRTARFDLIARDGKRLIQDLQFHNAMLVTFVWDDGASGEAKLSRKVLKSQWHGSAQSFKIEEPAAREKTLPVAQESKAEGKRKANVNPADKESKLKNLLNKGLFKR